MEKSKPIKKIKSGKVELAVWEGEFEGQKTYSYTISKSWKDKQGNWQSTNFLTKTDLKDVGYMVNAILCSSMVRQLNQINNQEKTSAPDVNEIPF